MKMTLLGAQRRAQAGFSLLSIIIGTIILLGGVFAFIASMDGSVANTTAVDQQNSAALYYIGQANLLTEAFERAVQRGVDVKTITYGNSLATDLFAPGYIDIPPPGPSVNETQKRYWIYRGNAFDFKGVGSDTVGDYAFFLELPNYGSVLAGNVCDAINTKLGSVSRANYGGWTTRPAKSDIYGAASNVLFATDKTTAASISVTLGLNNKFGRVGCFQTSDAAMIMYVIVQPG